MKCHRCYKNEHYIRNCVEFKLIKKSSKKIIKLINVVSIILTQIFKDKNAVHYLFMLITLYENIIMITIKTIIDNEIIHNFLFQLKIKKHNIVEIDIQSQDFECFDDTVLRIYKFHNFDVDVINQRNEKSRSQ